MCIVHYTVYFVHCIVCVRRTCRRDDGRYRPGTQVDRVRGHGSMRMLIDSRAYSPRSGGWRSRGDITTYPVKDRVTTYQVMLSLLYKEKVI